MSGKISKNLLKIGATTIFIVIISRAFGFLREMVISAVFGFSKFTDLFYQFSFYPTYLFAILTGPFTTALASTINTPGSPKLEIAAPSITRHLFLITSVTSALMILIACTLGFLGHINLSETIYPLLLISLSCVFMGINGLIFAFHVSNSSYSKSQLVSF